MAYRTRRDLMSLWGNVFELVRDDILSPQEFLLLKEGVKRESAGFVSDAERLYTDALAIAERGYSPDAQRVQGEALVRLADMWRYRKPISDSDPSERYERAAVLFGNLSPHNLGAVLQRHAIWLEMNLKYPEALVKYQHALALWKELCKDHGRYGNVEQYDFYQKGSDRLQAQIDDLIARAYASSGSAGLSGASSYTGKVTGPPAAGPSAAVFPTTSGSRPGTSVSPAISGPGPGATAPRPTPVDGADATIPAEPPGIPESGDDETLGEESGETPAVAVDPSKTPRTIEIRLFPVYTDIAAGTGILQPGHESVRGEFEVRVLTFEGVDYRIENVGERAGSISVRTSRSTGVSLVQGNSMNLFNIDDGDYLLYEYRTGAPYEPINNDVVVASYESDGENLNVVKLFLDTEGSKRLESRSTEWFETIYWDEQPVYVVGRVLAVLKRMADK